MAGAPTQTTLNANQLEAGCGWGGPGGMFFSESFQDAITANPGGGQANAFQLTRQNNRITTVATSGDSIKMPPALPGLEVFIINHGANPCQIFGSGTDQINDSPAATGVSMMANSTIILLCMTAGIWYTEGLATGFAPGSGAGFQTFSSSDGLVAHAGGGQASGTPLVSMQNFFSTVGTAGDSATLPPAKAGMQIDVINKTATSMNVFPASGETINNLSANTALAVAATTITLFFCGTNAAWWTK